MRHLLGHVAVDAGVVMVGDPGYSMGPEGSHGKTWDEFCEAILAGNTEKGVQPLGDGIGMVVQSGYGDGMYPVYAEYTRDNHVARVIVEFVGVDDD